MNNERRRGVIYRDLIDKFANRSRQGFLVCAKNETPFTENSQQSIAPLARTCSPCFSQEQMHLIGADLHSVLFIKLLYSSVS